MTKAKPKVRGKAPKRKNAAKVKRKPPAPVATIKPKRDAGGRRWYSDQERTSILSALRANDGNIALTAKEQQVPYLTLYCWAQGRRCPEAMQLQSDYDKKLEVAIAEIAWQCVALMPMKIDKAPLNHLTGLMDKAIEKMRLLRGESTGIGENRNTSVSIDLTRLSADEQRLFLELYNRSRGTAPAGTPDGGGTRPADGTGGTPQEGARLLRPVPAVLK